MKSIITKIMGESANCKVLDYLADLPGQDVTATDISEGTRLSRQHVYRVLKVLKKFEIVKESRTVGGTQMFALDDKSELSQIVVEFNEKIIKYWAKKNKLRR